MKFEIRATIFLKITIASYSFILLLYVLSLIAKSI